MQRAAQGPHANDLALGDGSFDGSFGRAAGAQADGPQRAEIVLCLNGREPTDGLGDSGERIMTDALMAQALSGESDGAFSG
jgi:hypothetical protein